MLARRHNRHFGRDHQGEEVVRELAPNKGDWAAELPGRCRVGTGGLDRRHMCRHRCPIDLEVVLLPAGRDGGQGGVGTVSDRGAVYLKVKRARGGG